MIGDNRIPVTILTGYLGSGKTTIINNLIKNTSRKIGVIVNEFGEIDIDGEIIQKNTDEIIKFSDKCMCCAVRGDIVNSVETLISQFKPEFVLIETSGLAHPVPIAMSLNEEELKDKVKLDAIICIIDAENFFEILDEDNMIIEQMDSADILIVTKSDLVDKDQKDKLINYIKQEKNNASILFSDNANIEENLIFDINSDKSFSETDTNHTHKSFDTRSYSYKGVFKKSRFSLFIDNLPSEIYRAKGFVNLDNKYYLFNKVGSRWELNFAEGYIDENKFVFIGKNLQNMDIIFNKLIH